MGRGASISATSTMHAQPTVKFEWLKNLVKEKTKSTSLKSETLHGYKNVLAEIRAGSTTYVDKGSWSQPVEVAAECRIEHSLESPPATEPRPL